MNKEKNSKQIYTGDKIKKAHKILKDREYSIYNAIKNNKITQLPINLFINEHDTGSYILKDNMIIHAENVDNNVYCYSSDGYFGMKSEKEGLSSNVSSFGSRNNRKAICTHILTKKKIYGIERDGKMYFEHNGKEVFPQFLNKSYDIYSDGDTYFANLNYLTDGYSRRNRNYREVYYEYQNEGNFSTKEQTYLNFLKSIYKESFKECKNLYGKNGYSYEVESTKLGAEQLIFRDCAYFDNDVFYIIPNRNSYIGCSVLLNAKENNGIKYCLLANTLYYYISPDIKGAVSIDSIYTEKVGNKYVIFNNKGELIFRDTPYHEYGTVEDNKIIKNDMIYNLDFTNTVIVNNTIINSDYPITKELEGEAYLVNNKYFVILKQNKLMLFYKTEKISNINVLKNYKNLRFERKKSNFYKTNDENQILIYAGDDDFYKLANNEYDLKSIKLISVNAAVIKDLSGRLYCVNDRGCKCRISSLKEYLEFSGDYNIVGLKSNGILEVNGNFLLFKDKCIKQNDKILWENVEYKGDLIFVSKEPVEGCKSSVRINFKDHTYPHIEFDGDSLYQDKYFDCYRNSKGYFVYIKKEGFEIQLEDDSEVMSIKNNSKFISTKRGYLINGFFIKSNLLSLIEKYNNPLFLDVIIRLQKLNYAKKNILEDIIFSEIISRTALDLQSYDINVNPHDLINPSNLKDTLLVLLNMKNLVERCESIPLNKDIENYLKDSSYDFTKSEFFVNKNISNDKSFINKGISIEKFNNYSEELTFTSTTAQNRLLKDNLNTTLFTQTYNLIGIRKKNIEGVLQLKNLEYLINLEKDINESISSVVNSMSTEQKILSEKILNKCGYKFHKLFKSYNITLDLMNMRIFINGKTADNISVLKYKQIFDDFIAVADKSILMIEKSNLHPDIKLFVIKYIKWATKHIVDDYSNIQTDVDFKEKTFTIKLWDRKDLITNLVQGNKTHCCIAADSYNVGALINYIYSKNVVLVEIRCKNDIIGQAFVYLAASENKINYKYESKHHLFTIIDNVEINNNYSQYSEDIAKNLQRFMINYSNHISLNISDVLLGTSYNDIEPPYRFSTSMDLNIIGNDHYKDNNSNFYKFI